VSELDDLVRTERFKEIHEARQQVIHDERALNEALAVGRIDDSQARRLFQRAVDAYVRELEYLLNPPDSDEDTEYWHEVEVGRLPLPNGQVAVVNGLGSYLDLDEDIQVEVARAEREHYYEVPEQRTETITVQPPWKLLRGAFRTANAAVSHLGLELDLGDPEGAEWDTDYRQRNGHDETTA
jgi:hypothetical protein